jgi:glucose/arabinose dehydrogenase
VPTGIASHDGRQFGASYASNLFLGSYDRAEVRRLVMEGVDLRSDTPFVEFSDLEFEQKPLDLVVGVDGSLWISTFASVWRVRRD